MSHALAISLRSIAAHERDHKDNNELAHVIEGAADEIERLRSQAQDRSAWVTLEQYTREVEENEKLREQLVSVKQHVGSLKQFVFGMNDMNWIDMKLRAERQLVEFSTLLSDD